MLSAFAPWLRVACLVAALLPATEAAAQLQSGTIQGRVAGPDGRPFDGATITLVDSLGTPISSVVSTAGEFRLTNVAPGSYGIRAEAPQLAAFVDRITVVDALPLRVELRLAASVGESVVVRGDSLDSAISRVTLAGDAVRRAPARLRSRGLQDAIATTPGWSTEDNGLLHVRGVDDGFLYVVDGVPIYERIDGLFGVSPDPAMIDTVSVMTGFIPPEFGLKSGGVIEVRSTSQPAERWLGSLDAGGGSDAGREFSTVAGGPVGRSLAVALGTAGQASSRFLDPVHPDNLHNDGDTVSGGAQVGWSLASGTLLSAVAGVGRSTFDVPHSEEQEESGQDQRQRIRTNWQTLSLQHSWSASTVSQAAAYHRWGSASLEGSEADTPLFVSAHRTIRRSGVLGSVTHHRGSHVFKVGGEAARLALGEEFFFVVTDGDEGEEAELSDGALAHTPDNPFVFRDRATPTLFSFYVQDSVRAHDRLTIDFGLRADWSRLLARASQWSPRAAVTYRWPWSDTTVRGSFGRFFQPPQPENLLLSSSEQARELSPFVDETGGGEALEPERQTSFEAGVNQPLGSGARLDVAVWHRRIENAADPNVLFGTTIVFPNAVARGRARGVDVRLELPRRGGWSGYANYANAKVTQFGPITGGLFVEDEVIEIGPGTAFTPDHDQRHVAALGVNYDHGASGLAVSVTGRYESGTPLEVDEDELDELAERPGAELVDFERGRVRPRQIVDLMASTRLLQGRRGTFTLRAALLNAAGERWAFNFGNPFSGTHFGPGRTFQVGFRAELK